MLELFSLEGRVALVTGSARGLGFEIARGMAEAGALVYLNGTSEDRLRQAVARLAECGIEVRSACFDVSNEDAAAEAIDRITAEQGRIDILVNNVGVRLREPLERIGSASLSAAKPLANATNRPVLSALGNGFAPHAGWPPASLGIIQIWKIFVVALSRLYSEWRMPAPALIT